MSGKTPDFSSGKDSTVAQTHHQQETKAVTILATRSSAQNGNVNMDSVGSRLFLNHSQSQHLDSFALCAATYHELFLIKPVTLQATDETKRKRERDRNREKESERERKERVTKGDMLLQILTILQPRIGNIRNLGKAKRLCSLCRD